jgi:hypothetical protein
MTTIITDGNFLIADMRTTTPIWLEGGVRTTFKNQRAYRDTTCKIILPLMMHAGQEQVLAAAFCGSTLLYAYYDNLAASKTPVNLDVEGMRLNGVHVGPHEWSTQGVFLLANGTLYVLDLSVVNGRYAVRKKHLKPKGVLGFGSGGSFWDRISCMATKPITPLQAFHFCAHLDKTSCNNYSVYSRAHHEMYAAVIPSEDEVRDAITSTQDSLQFYNPKAKPAGSQLVFEG